MGKLAELREAARREAREATGRLALAPVLQEMRECRAEIAALRTLLQELPDAVAERLAPVLAAAEEINARSPGTPASGGRAPPGGAGASEDTMLDAAAWTLLRDAARAQGRTDWMGAMDKAREQVAAQRRRR